nr:DUF308 domain-containing protein [Pseudalkalibacillus decolorationis]
MDNNRFNRENGEHRENESDFMEETAAEVVPLPEQERVMDKRNDRMETSTEDANTTEGRGIGIFAIALSIVSLFFLPVLLGAAGIIVGFFARRRGATSLGSWAIGLGIASIVISLIFAPFF